ncbi:MAG: FtsQ-type POTRA domain-containing protein, partial [Gammaproteobacteria bacterium]|nr:FtsQ-type POTRA domain-containing protein [Gammaproteobacteria bacterium]
MKRSPKSFFYTALFLILTILSLGAWYYIHLPTVLPIHNVKVIGNYQYVTQEQLRNAVLPDVARGFFNVNVLHSEQALVALPGVASASV